MNRPGKKKRPANGKMDPAGILLNEATGRYYPITFRPYPLPRGNGDAESALQRYKSVGHHTVGFKTAEEAKNHLAALEQHGFADCGVLWKWDGNGVPAMIEWFGKENNL